MENQDAAFISIACRLQTSVTPCTEIGQVDVHPVFDEDRVPVGVEKLSSLPVDFVHLAWALLLRSYVFSDTVSFGLFFTSPDEVPHEILHDHATTLKPLVGVKKALVCRYHAVSERKWGDWVPDAHQDLSQKGIEDIQINTAVRQWTQGALERHQSPCLHSDGFAQFVSTIFSSSDTNLWGRDVAKWIVVFEPSVCKF